MSFFNIPTRAPSLLSIAQRVQAILVDANKKHLKLNPTLTADAIAKFETTHGISLPSEYRLFIQHAGNGGDGPPHYGLVALGEVPECWEFNLQLSQVFPFTKLWVWEVNDESDEGTRDQAHHGTLMLGTEGCGEYAVLVVTGPQRGRVWIIADVGITPDDAGRDFLTWYEDWLATK